MLVGCCPSVAVLADQVVSALVGELVSEFVSGLSLMSFDPRPCNCPCLFTLFAEHTCKECKRTFPNAYALSQHECTPVYAIPRQDEVDSRGWRPLHIPLIMENLHGRLRGRQQGGASLCSTKKPKKLKSKEPTRRTPSYSIL